MSDSKCQHKGLGKASITNLSKPHATVFLVEMPEHEGIISISELEEKYPDIKEKMMRGDIIENVSKSGYRSQGVYLYDGENVINQYIGYDDYGSVPIEFKAITEFPLHYWDKPYRYTYYLEINNDYVPNAESEFYWHEDNTLVCIDLSQMDEVKEPIQDSEIDSYTDNVIKITHNNVPYILLIEDISILKKTPLIVNVNNNNTCDFNDFSEKYNVPIENIMYIE
jgi:hypothetical protein